MQKLRIVKLGLLLPKMVHAAFVAFVTLGKEALLKTVSMILKLRSNIFNWIIALQGRSTFYRDSGESKRQLIRFIFDDNLCLIIATGAPLNLNTKVISDAGSTIQSLPGLVMSRIIVADEGWFEFVNFSLMKFLEDSKRCLDSLRFTRSSERLGPYFDDYTELTKSYEEVKPNSEIPYALYSIREVVSRVLKKIEQQRFIAMGHWRIRIKEFTEEALNIPSKHLDYVL